MAHQSLYQTLTSLSLFKSYIANKESNSLCPKLMSSVLFSHSYFFFSVPYFLSISFLPRVETLIAIKWVSDIPNQFNLPNNHPPPQLLFLHFTVFLAIGSFYSLIPHQYSPLLNQLFLLSCIFLQLP